MKKLTRRTFLRDGLTASVAVAGVTSLAGGMKTDAQQWATQTPYPAEPMVASTIAAEDAVPHVAAISIADMLDHALRVKAGQKVLLLSYLDGLYGGENVVDRDAVRWIKQALEARGAIPDVVWVDARTQVHQWDLPDVIRQAFERNDRAIIHTFDLEGEEIHAFMDFERSWGLSRYQKDPTSPEIHTTHIRNFASTAPLLCTALAQTPHELVSMIRHQSGVLVQSLTGQKFELTDPLGTHLTGTILPVGSGFSTYSAWREEGPMAVWPEWVMPAIHMSGTSGTYVYDRMLGWWSRYIGVPPFFKNPIQLTIKDGKIVSIEGKSEAELLREFLKDLEGRTGDAEGVYKLEVMHFGVHPQAYAAPQQCPNPLYRRLIEHAHTANFHVHVGSPKSSPTYPYMLHITGDIRYPTFRIGNTMIHEAGHLTALDDPKVREVAERYPGRPGLGKMVNLG